MLTISEQTDNQNRINLDDWQLLAHVSQIFRSVSDSFTDQVDIPRGQATVLCVVAKQDGITQSEIAEQLSVQGATVTNMLQRLEEAGLVSRQRDPEDTEHSSESKPACYRRSTGQPKLTHQGKLKEKNESSTD